MARSYREFSEHNTLMEAIRDWRFHTCSFRFGEWCCDFSGWYILTVWKGDFTGEPILEKEYEKETGSDDFLADPIFGGKTLEEILPELTDVQYQVDC